MRLLRRLAMVPWPSPADWVSEDESPAPLLPEEAGGVPPR